MSEPDPPPPSPRRLRVVDLRDPGGVVRRVEGRPESLQLRFAPIADLRRGVCAGYEALLASDERAAASPQAWSQAVHPDTAGRLEAGLVRRALRERLRLPDGAFLLLNVSAAGLRSPELPAALADAGRLDRVVLAIGGEAHGEDAARVRRTLEALRGAGGQVAVDESGSGVASLHQLLALRPDFVRIGAGFVVELDRDQAKAAVVEALGTLASRIDACLIARDVGCREELAALRRLGVQLAQGAVVGPLAPTMAPLPNVVSNAIRRATPPTQDADTVAALVEERPALPWGGSLEAIADAFLEDPRHDVVVLVDERRRPLALAERAALLRGEPFERPVMRVTPASALKAVARRAAARPPLERFHPLVACDRRGVYLGVVRVEQLLDALARD